MPEQGAKLPLEAGPGLPMDLIYRGHSPIEVATVETFVLMVSFLPLSFAKFCVPRLHGFGSGTGSLQAPCIQTVWEVICQKVG